MSTRVLLVEDDISTNFALSEFFKGVGYDVDVAWDAPSATRCLDENQYDVVITDLHLSPQAPGEGMGVLAHARRRYPAACIVMLTANAAPTAEAEAKRRGVDLFATKPVALQQLGHFIDTMRRQERASFESGGKGPLQ